MTLKSASALPPIFQGGMGIGVSNWSLAKAVSTQGQLGIVSGTSMDVVISRLLQLGDPEGNLRRALEKLPIPGAAERILERFFIPGGKAADAPFRPLAMMSVNPGQDSREMAIASSFTAVTLAKEGHSNPVGFNLMEKVQLATLYCLYGAMLAGIDVVLMGAGIPRQIPGVLDSLAAGTATELRIQVAGGTGNTISRLDPADYRTTAPAKLHRPLFLPIVSSHVLAENLLKKSNGRVDGFVVEGPDAGGHNAPPRGPMRLSENNEPIYSDRDAPDFAKLRELGVPFWLGGGYGGVGKLKHALSLGAAGVQVGTPFAFCRESGFTPEVKARILGEIRDGTLQVYTSPKVSPSGFPFKVSMLSGTMADEKVYNERCRVCDIGLLRECYEKADGTVGYRCPSESIAAYVAKGGSAEDAEGRGCVCNSLSAAIGLAQIRSNGYVEPPLITVGSDLESIRTLIQDGRMEYTAADVISQILA